MGDMAEYYMELAFSHPDFDDLEQRAPKTCKHCGAQDLEWGQHNGQWRLYNSNGDLHKCLSAHESLKVINRNV